MKPAGRENKKEEKRRGERRKRKRHLGPASRHGVDHAERKVKKP